MILRCTKKFIKIIVVIIIIPVCCILPQDQTDSLSSVSVDLKLQGSGTKDSMKSNDLDIMGYPYAFYSPEAQLAVGAGGIILFRTAPDKNLNPSKVSVSGFYSTIKNYNIIVGPQIYFPGIKHTYFAARLSFSKSTGKFYGTGWNTPEITNPDYSMKRFSISAEISSIGLLIRNVQSGLKYEYANNKMLDQKDNPYFYNEKIVGENGGKVGGLGITFTFDRRDNIFYPSDGNYLRLEAMLYRRFFGSSFIFNKYTIDFRQFWELIETHYLAFQVYSEFTSGTVPFFSLPALGGGNRMRGYFEGRYRDRQYFTSQLEYRKLIIWRFGIDIFASAGTVAGKLSEYRFDGLKYTYGLGLRFVFDEAEKVNLRADIGFSKSGNGVYFAMEEAF